MYWQGQSNIGVRPEAVDLIKRNFLLQVFCLPYSPPNWECCSSRCIGKARVTSGGADGIRVSYPLFSVHSNMLINKQCPCHTLQCVYPTTLLLYPVSGSYLVHTSLPLPRHCFHSLKFLQPNHWSYGGQMSSYLIIIIVIMLREMVVVVVVAQAQDHLSHCPHHH